LPLIISINPGELVKLTSAVLFLFSPIFVLVNGMPIFTAANVAAETIERLEVAINRHVRPMSRRRGDPLVIHEEPFHDITFENVLFDYIDASGNVAFRLGPIDLSILPGETIFISGGNGSGKSTFLRLLTCLYFPTTGDLTLDGQRLSEINAATYRALFA